MKREVILLVAVSGLEESVFPTSGPNMQGAMLYGTGAGAHHGVSNLLSTSHGLLR
jgi:hypothetical protein